MRILALVPGSISDQLLFFPTLDTLRRSFPKARIDVVVEPGAKSAYEVYPFVNQVIPFDFQSSKSLSDWANLLGILRDQYHDIAISVRRGWSVGLMLWLTGTPRRISYEGASGQFFFTDTVPLKAEQYTAHAYHDLLRGLNITTPCPELTVNLAKRHIDWAEQQQQELGIKDTGYVLMYSGTPGTTATEDKGEAYPVERWQEIVQSFQDKQPDMPLVTVEWGGNQAFVSALTQACPAVKPVTATSLSQLGAMIAGANLMLSTASVPMHLGVGLKVYTLGLFGDADPQKLLPESDRFVAIASDSNKVSDIPAKAILDKVWGG